MATRVAVMYFGKKVEEAETEQLFKNPKHDYTKTLLDSILVPDPRSARKNN
jgi:peptide/nickel transport system ATP-binding protein